MAKKSTYTYVPSKLISRARFDAADRSQRLTIELREGKDKYNLKASLKDLQDKDAKAQPGARANFDGPEKGKKAFEELVATAEKKGWNRLTDTRSAFTEIPDSPGKGKANTSTAKPKHS